MPAQQKIMDTMWVSDVVLVLVNSAARKVRGIDINSNVRIRTMQEQTLDYSRSLHTLRGIAEYHLLEMHNFFNNTF